MKRTPFHVPRPCHNCPFLKTGPAIRLTRGRIREIAGGMLQQQGATFDCHKTTAEADEEGEDGEPQMVHTAESLHCAGALIFAEKHGTANQMMRIAERLGMYDAAALMADQAAVDSVFDTLGQMLATAIDRGAPRRRRSK